MELITNFLAEIGHAIGLFTNAGLRLFPIYVASFIIICFGVYLYRNPGSPFLRWLFPKAIYAHPSHLMDIKLFFIGRFFTFLGVFNSVAVSSLMAFWIFGLLSTGTAQGSGISPWLVALLILLVNDFAVYWTHRFHHEMHALWPFHAVHHSAEVMTPVTVYRKHPIYDVFSSVIRGTLYGIFQGIMLVLVTSEVSFSTIAGTNAFYFLFNLLGSNLRHSHVWLSYGRVLEHVFISPAQHQVHHSIATRHWNKNYGEVLAIWDWMFGTLYVTGQDEDVEFGLEGQRGENQPHATVKDALVSPIKESLNVLKPGKISGSAKAEHGAADA